MSPLVVIPLVAVATVAVLILLAFLSEERRVMSTCPAAVNLAGEHIPCDWPVDEQGRHDGWAHANAEHELVWSDGRDPVSAQAVRDA